MATERTPIEARTPRMETLARLPVFFALNGKRAVVAGGDSPSVWKAELLSAAGATVDVYAAEPSEELLALVQEAPHGTIGLHQRRWRASDFTGAAIAIGGCADDEEAAAFAAAARAIGVPVNVIDKPAFCDFSFGSIVNRSPLVIGISTDGAAPVFAQAIRAKIEALIPLGFAQWAAAARRWRDKVKASGLSFAGRRRFWHVFTAFAVTNPNNDPTATDYDRFLTQTQGEGVAVESGSVTLVGAGPGDPELLTLRAVRALQSADVILIDDLVSSEVLDFARREAKKMMVGKTGHGPACKQDEINALMISLAKSGKRVVRLKGGDPMIFGRGGEEVLACRLANIPIEVVPGISAAQAVASRLGVSLTHRKHAKRVQFVTGHGANGKLPDDLDWKSLSDPAATTAVYMPLKTIGDLVKNAIAAGLDPSTPAVAVARVTRPDEAVIAAAISDLPARLSTEAPSGPVLVLIGHVLAERTTESVTDWLGNARSA
jgi:uroporphyrin-III C-methyltransferase/precorrin-2 dehydrogenase/sirohydrochlorin ferrochelatase